MVALRTRIISGVDYCIGQQLRRRIIDHAKENRIFMWGMKGLLWGFRKINVLSPIRFYTYARFHRRNSTIIVIGDSHARFFSGRDQPKGYRISNKGGGIFHSRIKDKKFSALHLGPTLAYNLNRYGTRTKGREKIEFLEKRFFCKETTIICCFGEIDIRVWVLEKAGQNNVSYDKIIQRIVENYMSMLLYLSHRGYRVYAFGPIPSQKDNAPFNKDFPRIGSEVERNIATKIFNNTLKVECLKKGIGFFSIFDDLIKDNYLTREEYLIDGCHLSEKARHFLNVELVKNGLI